MSEMMSGSSMMFGMGLGSILVLLVVVLVVAAAVKYLFFGKRDKD